MDTCQLTKLTSDREGHNHMIWDGVQMKNDKFSFEGMVVNPAIIGQRFMLTTSKEWYATSPVQAISDTDYGCVIKTENSTYNIRVL